MGTAETTPRPGPAPSPAEPRTTDPLHQVVRDAEAAPPRFALSVVFTIMGGFFVMQLVDILSERPGTLGVVLACTLLPASMVLVLTQTLPRCRAFRRRWGRWVLLTQCLLVALPCTLMGWCWGGMGGFVGASALLVLPTRQGVTVFAAMVACVVLGTALHDPAGTTAVPYMGVSTVLTGVIVLSLIRLADLTLAVHAAREDFVRSAVSEERLRFSHDLHDLLGYSLSAVCLKVDLAGQLVRSEPERAQQELWSVADISRQALADVREVSRRYRSLSLLNELTAARGMLATAGIEAHVSVDYERVSSEVDTALATVVREGVTNVVRHSDASRCLLEAGRSDGRVHVRIVNDGVRSPQQKPDGTGCGIDSLSARMKAVGGRLSAGLDERGRFQLLAETSGGGQPAPQTQPASRAIRTASSRLRAPSLTTEDVR